MVGKGKRNYMPHLPPRLSRSFNRAGTTESQPMINPSNLTIRFSRTGRNWITPMLCLALCGLLPISAGALSIYTLSNGNSSMNINVASSKGAYDWIVDGRDQLNQDWFSFRIGKNGPETSINSIGSPKVHQPTGSTLDAIYSNRQLSVQVLTSLMGDAPGTETAGFSDQITIQNLTAHTLDFHFFQYASFANFGVAQFAQNPRGLVNDARLTGVGGSSAEQIDTVLTPGANHAVIGSASRFQTAGQFPAPSGNCVCVSTNGTWILEWDYSIAARGTLIISDETNLARVPEPSAWALLLFGMALWARGQKQG